MTYNETASDIFADIIQAGAHSVNNSEQQKRSIYAWTDGAYIVCRRKNNG